MNMKRNIARTLALMLVLCTLLSQTALAATTYYVDVTITGPDADGVERTLSASSSRYGTMDTPLAAELASVVDSAYHEMETVFSGTGLRNIVDTGAQAFQEGESAWNLYVEKYYDSVDSSFKDTLKSLSSTFANLTVDRVNRVTYRDNGRLYTVTVTLRGYTTGSGSSSNTPVAPDGHKIVVEPVPNNTLRADKNTLPKGETAVIRDSAASNGYVLSDLAVKDVSGNDIPVRRQSDGVYAFTMPESSVSVRAVMVADPDMTGISKQLNTDQNIAYMQGMTDGRFYPASSVTRGQVAQIFYRLLKEQKVSSKSTFTDVPDTLWCAEAVNALASLGIVEGVGNGKFAPNQSITRAEFVTICARFTQVSASGATFTDVPASHWAFDAISTAASFGWVNGVGNGQFAPNQHITRAQAAVLLNRLLGRCMAGQSYENARQYPDVPQTHWAWKNICEASDGVALR
ncbi:MAG: S-layer homology domain-containing protein [Oscillibacter sp.]|nr:S-layer homology domain-containing protein [Oscillibacter sp.]